MVRIAKKFVFILFFLILIIGCDKKSLNESSFEPIDNSEFIRRVSVVLSNAEIPLHISGNILENMSKNNSFILDLYRILQLDPYLYTLVDKNNYLDAEYEPQDLVDVTTGIEGITANRMLRREAYDSVMEIKNAARQAGLVLNVLSAYRSYFYQGRVYTNNVIMMGQEEADRYSARPGSSQHQLGLAVDFNSLENDFARTREGMWLTSNAYRFGWSLSYPDSYEEITGYAWESWHYRYVGRELAQFINVYFYGVQQYALRFIHEWVIMDKWQ